MGIPERRVVDPIVPHSPCEYNAVICGENRIWLNSVFPNLAAFSIDERLKSRKRPAPTEDDPR